MVLSDLRNGRERGMEYLYDRYSVVLLRFINLYVSDRDLAKDILQETYISLWGAHNNLSDDTQFDKLLFSIAKNKSLNAIRTINNRAKHTISENKLPETIHMEFLASLEMDTLEEEDINIEIRELYKLLPETYRTIFSMNRIDGMTYSQIALQLNISTKTVEKKMSHALSIFKEKMKKKFFILFLCSVWCLLMCY